MAFTYDLKKDLRYRQGIEQGHEQGILEEKIFSIRNMTRQGFAVELIAGILEVPADFVLDVQKQLAQEPYILKLLEKPDLQSDDIARQMGVSVQLVRVLARVRAKRHG